MNTNQITCFISAAETLNFTRTAKQLYLTQPTVTHHIASLEEELGYALFERVNKQVVLTPAGRKFYQLMKTVSMDIQNAVLTAKHYGGMFRQELVIGCGSSEYENIYLPEVIRTFKTEHEDTYISFNLSPIREKLQLLQEGKIDVLFSTTSQQIDTLRFSFHPLTTYPMVCVVHQDNRLAKFDKITMEDIGGQNLVLLNESDAPPEMDLLQKQLEKHYPSDISHYLSDMRQTHLIILCNLGIAIMPEFKYQKDEHLRMIPFEWKDRIPYGIVTKKNEERTYVRDFVTASCNMFHY